MVGSLAGRNRRRTDRTWRCRRSGRAGLEPYRAEERLLRLGQENCLREARIVEAAAEVHARLDRKYLELIDRESRRLQVEWIHDLGAIFADQHDVASPEGDAREETMSTPIAALAIVLAITIRARSSASGGRSVTLVPVTKRASSPAMLIDSSPWRSQGRYFGPNTSMATRPAFTAQGQPA